ncbi:5'-methylthioadenosine/adenosylhomocysteine nucleosidase [Comamonas sp.]|uniref:5'-methylthioadenosine/adenosylhomocysteine nucleosidase n=1 Tax=Comamonas sp. TaxID=34028 RepID=UPI003A8FFDDD
MKTTLAILSALPEEQEGLVHMLADQERMAHAGRVFWRGTLHGRPVVCALSGIGKVAAATTATALIERFGAQAIVFTGVAGALAQSVKVGDVVVASHYVQHDLDASPLFPRFELPGYGRSVLACDAPLSQLLAQATAECLAGPAAAWAASMGLDAPQLHQGLVASGDRFVSGAAESAALRANLLTAGHGALAVEMEGAAIAQVCADYGLAFAAMRSISDKADDTAHVDFPAFVQKIARNYACSILPRLCELL